MVNNFFLRFHVKLLMVWCQTSFFGLGLQLVQHWFGVNRLALENSLVQFGLQVRMVWLG